MTKLLTKTTHHSPAQICKFFSQEWTGNHNRMKSMSWTTPVYLSQYAFALPLGFMEHNALCFRRRKKIEDIMPHKNATDKSLFLTTGNWRGNFVNVHVYSPDTPTSSVTCRVYWSTLLWAHLLLEKFAFLQLESSNKTSFCIQPGTCHCYVSRGSMESEIWPTLLYWPAGELIFVICCFCIIPFKSSSLIKFTPKI